MLGTAESKKALNKNIITKKSVRLRNHSTLSTMLRDKSKSLSCTTILKVGFYGLLSLQSISSFN